MREPQLLHRAEDLAPEHHRLTEERHELGEGHLLRVFRWAPNRRRFPTFFDGVPDVDPCGAVLCHSRPDGARCGGVILFDTASVAAIFPDRARWTVETWRPLTLSPGVICSPTRGGCGDQGAIRGGLWLSEKRHIPVTQRVTATLVSIPGGHLTNDTVDVDGIAMAILGHIDRKFPSMWWSVSRDARDSLGDLIRAEVRRRVNALVLRFRRMQELTGAMSEGADHEMLARRIRDLEEHIAQLEMRRG